MKSSHTLSDLQQVRALADPLRQQILETLCHEPMTTKQVAERLGMRPTRLYHHVALLHRLGLVRLVRARRKRGTVEKYFEAVGRRFAIDRRLFRMVAAPRVARSVRAVALRPLEATMLELERSIDRRVMAPTSTTDEVMLLRTRIRTSANHIEELKRRIQAWCLECQAAHRAAGEIEYGLTVAFYPIVGRATGRRRVTRSRR